MFSILNAAWYVGTAVLYAVGAITLVALYHFVPIVYRSSTSPLRNLQGPPSSSLVFGHFKAIGKAENSVLQEEWEQKYGSTLAYRELFSVRVLRVVMFNPIDVYVHRLRACGRRILGADSIR